MPNVVGMTRPDAVALLSAHGLSLMIRFVSDAGHPNDVVLEQSGTPGSEWTSRDAIELTVAADDLARIRIRENGSYVLKATDLLKSLDEMGIRWERYDTIIEGVPAGMVSSIGSDQGSMDEGGDYFIYSRHGTTFVNVIVSLGSSLDGYVRLTEGWPVTTPLSQVLDALKANGTPYKVYWRYMNGVPKGSITWMLSTTIGDIVHATYSNAAFYVRKGGRSLVSIDVSLGSVP